jgi:hypothetical protein
MVSFSHTPYNTALQCVQAQDQLLGQIMKEGNFFEKIDSNGFKQQLDKWMSEYHEAVQQLDFNQ